MKALDILLAATLAAAAGSAFFATWQMFGPLGFGLPVIAAGYGSAAVCGVASIRLFTIVILGADAA
jgi:hypothetical protein